MAHKKIRTAIAQPGRNGRYPPMADISYCLNRRCQHVADGIVAQCPECGGKTRTSRAIRALGWVSVALGAFLVCFMGYIAWNMAPMLASPGGHTPGGSSFTGTAEQARMIRTLFGAVILFGFGSIVNGAFQIATGRRSKLLMMIVLLLAAGLFVYSWVTTLALKG